MDFGLGVGVGERERERETGFKCKRNGKGNDKKRALYIKGISNLQILKVYISLSQIQRLFHVSTINDSLPKSSS